MIEAALRERSSRRSEAGSGARKQRRGRAGIAALRLCRQASGLRAAGRNSSSVPSFPAFAAA